MVALQLVAYFSHEKGRIAAESGEQSRQWQRCSCMPV
jgi:hypothetical protein